MHQLEQLVAPLRDRARSSIFSIAGWRGTNGGFISFTLAPWDERERTQQEIGADIARLAERFRATAPSSASPTACIRGAGSGLQFAIAGDDYDQLAASADKVIAGLKSMAASVWSACPTRRPSRSSRLPSTGSAALLGVPIDGLAAVMQSMLDGQHRFGLRQ